MSLPTLGRIARLSIPHHTSRSISRSSIRCAASAEQIKQRLYDADPVHLGRTAPDTSRLNRRLEIRAHDRNVGGVVAVWNKGIQEKIKPDATTYTTLFEVFASYGLFDMTVKVFKDMIAMDLGDKQRGLNYILQSAASNPKLEAKALAMFETHGIKYNATTYQHLLESCARRDNIERALELVNEMDKVGIIPNADCVQIVIMLAARLGMSQLAMEMATKSIGVPEVVDEKVRMSILMSAAANLHAEVVQWAWKLVRETSALPTEPLCIEILNTAGRHGLPGLALEVLECLQKSRVTIMEYHLAPLIGAYATAGQLCEAYLALDKFSDYDVPVLPESASALVAAISTAASKLDEAWDVLSHLPRPVNIAAVNLTIQAAVNQSDMQRAIGIYKELSDLECAPTANTFDILLAGCLGISHAELGERLYADMLSRQIDPTLQTLSRLVLLSLTQDTYELAFERLEDIKSRKMTPPARIYEALVRRCVQEGDPRAELALEDMSICGYEVSRELKNFLLRNDAGGGRSKR